MCWGWCEVWVVSRKYFDTSANICQVLRSWGQFRKTCFFMKKNPKFSSTLRCRCRCRMEQTIVLVFENCSHFKTFFFLADNRFEWKYEYEALKWKLHSACESTGKLRKHIKYFGIVPQFWSKSTYQVINYMIHVGNKLWCIKMCNGAEKMSSQTCLAKTLSQQERENENKNLI